ncbi:MAG: hypothetical protein V4726_19965 [Verrucomicrobiota bacterium]
MKRLDDNLWIQTFPLSVLGTQHGRTVTLIRLASGRSILHSMAPFSPADAAEIRALGDPSWLAEAMLLHDTYAREGRSTFPGALFLGPQGFSDTVKFPTQSLRNPPAEWAGEVEVIEILGAPRLKEHVLIHKPSRTLIVADLIFNFRPEERGWDRFFHRYIAGFKRYPGMSRIFRACISDRAAFQNSIAQVLETDFDRIIVGHGEVIETNGRELLRRAMADAGLL